MLCRPPVSDILKNPMLSRASHACCGPAPGRINQNATHGWQIVPGHAPYGEGVKSLQAGKGCKVGDASTAGSQALHTHLQEQAKQANRAAAERLGPRGKSNTGRRDVRIHTQTTHREQGGHQNRKLAFRGGRSIAGRRTLRRRGYKPPHPRGTRRRPAQNNSYQGPQDV